MTMAAVSPIEWTERTWNPVVGCAVHSPGCTNCYAMAMAARLERMGVAHYAGLTRPTKAGPVWTGEFRAAPDHVLTEPLRRRKPTTWFVNSMSDLFGEGVPDALIDRVFAVMALCPQHTFQVLTKRAGRMREYFAAVQAEIPSDHRPDVVPARYDRAASELSDSPCAALDEVTWPLPNVWLGVSAEDQARADERVPDLLATPAAIRWLSAEPLLGPLDLTRLKAPRFTPEDEALDWRFDALTEGDTYEFEDSLGFWESGDGPWRNGLDWVVAGGESGPGARPMHPDWARNLRDQCLRAGVPFFFKQWGEWWEVGSEERDPETGDHFLIDAESQQAEDLFERGDRLISIDGRTFSSLSDIPIGLRCRFMTRLGKKAAGRILDGRTWDERPEPRP